MNNDYYYAVTVTHAPWENSTIIDRFTTHFLATRAADFVRDAYMDRLQGGIDVRVRECAGKIINTQAGLRLEQTPMGGITQIKTEIIKEDYKHLLNLTFEDNIIVRNKKRSQPKTISNENYSCVRASSSQTNGVVGYYSIDRVASKALEFLNLLNQYSEVNFSVTAHQGPLIISNSGKKWVETTSTIEEVKSKLDLKEYRRLFQFGELEPIQWLQPTE